MTGHVTIQSDSVEQTMRIASSFATRLQRGDIVTLDGPLGSGKTVFVRGLAKGLGLSPNAVSSPTFVICQEYSSAAAGSAPLIHIDAYRLAGPEELETIGWDEMIHDVEAIIAVEWPSRIAAALPPSVIEVQFEHVGPHSRRLVITAPANRADRIAALVDAASSTAMKTAKCRTCSTAIEPTAATFPFCSSRCRLADLGRWFNEGFRVSRPVETDDELQD